ncbi:unnamed protein product [Zymoseptoria tritici ST99CH_1A5]|uniref:F-box domain-containing protein n=1 Tax=Zymoseptoria tritici ST99CH_1A5 TaxID=1276529 RepID=A0A1Y6LG91_ZYMTR|nr:unnamed protein product [Zymoseptoria tritici ST99CH_1A5]
MDRLPDEVIVQIISFLDIIDIVNLQRTSSRYLALARDNAIWKLICFDHSRSEALRRRQHQLQIQDPRLAELRNTWAALPGPNPTAWDVSQLVGSEQPRAAVDPDAEARVLRTRALANWEPGYPTERLDHYDEFIARHAPVNIGWLNLPGTKDDFKEATGLAVLHDPASTHAVSPLSDGSISVFDLSARTTHHPNGGGGRLLAHSAPGLLTGLPLTAAAEHHHAIMTSTGAVESVSINSSSRRGFFAVQQHLHEVDLTTLQLVSSKEYSFPITALSSVSDDMPLVVGTSNTLHLYDARDPTYLPPPSSGELIGGRISSHAMLEEPGPLSILHTSSDEIYVSGRFKSLLSYDLRSFPRLRGTIFTGAPIACLASLPYPFIPRILDLLRNPGTSIAAFHSARTAPGTTLMAAGSYKGKGSLELYGIPSHQSYQNRQTASSSKLFSVASHGGRIVFSDGDGNLKWVERDAFSSIRTFNINDALAGSQSTTTQPDRSTPRGIWNSTTDQAPGQGDIVQKILPSSPPSTSPSHSDRPDTAQQNLLLYTGDGRLGVLGFGAEGRNPLGEDLWHDAVEEQVSTEQRAREDAERSFGETMRRALERSAEEVRFVRGLGMGYGGPLR